VGISCVYKKPLPRSLLLYPVVRRNRTHEKRKYFTRVGNGRRLHEHKNSISMTDASWPRAMEYRKHPMTAPVLNPGLHHGGSSSPGISFALHVKRGRINN